VEDYLNSTHAPNLKRFRLSGSDYDHPGVLRALASPGVAPLLECLHIEAYEEDNEDWAALWAKLQQSWKDIEFKLLMPDDDFFPVFWNFNLLFRDSDDSMDYEDYEDDFIVPLPR